MDKIFDEIKDVAYIFSKNIQYVVFIRVFSINIFVINIVVFNSNNHLLSNNNYVQVKSL